MFNNLQADQITVCIACGYTDLRYGTNNLVGIIQSGTDLNPFTKSCFSFAEEEQTESKDCFGKEADFFRCTNAWKMKSSGG
jgi:hypothetical protein